MKSRAYTQTARAADAAATAERILDAATARYAQLPYESVRLEDVALDAQVAPQTVLRRFGSKAGLIVAVAERGLARIAETRIAQRASDPAATLRELVVHYRVWGALILKMYAEAPRIEGMPEVAARGRAYHLAWCRTHFEEHLPVGLDARDRARRMAQIVALCDATTWRILTDDSGLADTEVERALAELLLPLLAPAGSTNAPR